MSILKAQHVSKSFGADEIFAGITVDIPHGARIAMVGPNGAGKTTLLNILIGQDVPTEGELTQKKGLQIGFLPQRPMLMGERTVWEEMLTAFADLRVQEANLRELEHAMADPTRTNEHDDLLERYGQLQEQFEDAGGYEYELEIKRVLQGLGFDEDDFQRPLSQLSGGQVTRALLARLLLEKPDLLVLDEPTNHLDIQAVEWLEGYLKDWEGAILIVSHDRYFMDNVVSTVWELDFGEIAAYRGNYSHYVSQREARYERLVKEYEAQQAFIQKEQDYIQRNIAGQNTAQAKGRRRRLERLLSGTNRFGQATDKPWLVQRPRRRSKHLGLALDASDAGRTGHEVLKTRGLEIGYPDDSGPLFQVPDILLVRQEVAAIIGPNGAGKSTFLKTILGELTAWQGEYAWGANVKLGYFAQAHERLNEANSILDELLDVKNLPLSKARDYLARYQFTGEDVYRPVATLSGGERGRLALAKLALDGANVLLLDEPTNHLDIASQEVLQNVLADYEGTILLVSHDRYLIDALATQIWAIKPGQMIAFQGSYRAYLEALANTGPPGGSTGGDDNGRRSRRTNRNGSATDEHPSGLNPYQRQQRLEQLEGMIQQLEAEIAEISGALEAASAAGNVDAVVELGQKYAETEDQLNDTMAEWMHLA